MSVGEELFDVTIDLSMSYSFRLSTRTAAVLSDKEHGMLRPIGDKLWMNSLKLVELSSSKINGTELPTLIGQVGGVTDTVGMSVLNRFITTVDFATNEVSLVPRRLRQYHDHSFCDGLSLELSKNIELDRELLTVEEVLANSIGDRSGFVAGDQFTSIDATDLTSLSRDSVIQAFHTLANIRDKPLSCGIIRAGERKEILLLGAEVAE